MPRCPSCRRNIPARMEVCPYCGARRCRKCGQVLPPGAESCPYCDTEVRPLPGEGWATEGKPRPVEKQQVSNKWYLLPVLLGVVGLLVTFYTDFSGPYLFFVPIHSTYGLLGGFIAYFLNRKRDPQKAQGFIVVGALMLMLVGFVAFAQLGTLT